MSKYDTMIRIKGNNSVRGKPADFLLVAHFARPFFIKNILLGGRMQIMLIKNPDESLRKVYQIARVVYAETHAVSLRAVEALTSMIKNFAIASGHDVSDVITDKNLFESLNKDSSNHELLSVAADNRGFQMCVRVARRMINGGLPDCCYGATKFHHDGYIPGWATSRGYIADIDGLLFYL